MQMLSEDRWFPVALADQIAPESSHPVVLDGYGLAVWRSRGGAVHAWEDRCPHRGMRLSFGFVRGEALTCLYHGWQFAESGQCRKIPAHPDLDPPKTICARAYPTATAHGIVYANLADAPTAFSGDDAEGWHAVRSIYLPLSEGAVHDYLMAPDNLFGAAAGRGAQDSYEFSTVEAGRVILALQRISPDKTAVHVTCDSADPSARIAMARRIVRMRRELDPR